MNNRERVGALPLTAYHTTSILTEMVASDAPNQGNNNNDEDEETGLMGIARKPLDFHSGNEVESVSSSSCHNNNNNNNNKTTNTNSGNSINNMDNDTNNNNNDSILMTDDKLGLLKDLNADPPIERNRTTTTTTIPDTHHGVDNKDDYYDDEGSEEYHSPLEEEEEQDLRFEPYQTNQTRPPPPASACASSSSSYGWRRLPPPQSSPSSSNTAHTITTTTTLSDAAAASSLLFNNNNNNNHHDYAVHQPPPPAGGGGEDVLLTTMTPLELESDYARLYHHHPSFALGDSDMVPQRSMDALSERSLNTNTSSSSSGSTRRRRRRGRGLARHNSSGSGSSSSGGLRTNHHHHHQIPETIQEGRDSRLRASLDAGMAALRRWIRSRNSHLATTTTTTTPSSSPRRTFRRNSNSSSSIMLSWQPQPRDGGGGGNGNAQIFSSPSMHLGEMDILALTNSVATATPRDDSFLPPPIPNRRRQRERTLSEPEASGLRNYIFQRATRGTTAALSMTTTTTSAERGHYPYHHHHHNTNNAARWPTETTTGRRGGGGDVEEGGLDTAGRTVLGETPPPPPLGGSSPLATAVYSSSLFHTPHNNNNNNNATNDVSSLEQQQSATGTHNDDDDDDDDNDPNREARTRWLRINRRFQLTITVVALLFSLLLFAILVCWVVLTSAYVVSIDRSCDVPLKSYFWLATLQLILDVFRTDIMRHIFRYDAHANDRIPSRVIFYNVAYLAYAVLVLRMGITSVFRSPDATCRSTATELFQASTAFVSLSIAAWTTIIFGYLVPFCCVATLLTLNGYNPADDDNHHDGGGGANTAGNQRRDLATGLGGVFPTAYNNHAGAPPGVIDQMKTVLLEEFPDSYPKECCICMNDFVAGEVIVATECDHVFHKRCCQEWLRHSRTCPVCRTDIPSSINYDTSNVEDTEDGNNGSRRAFHPSATRPFPGREEFRMEVVNLLQILRQQEDRARQRSDESDSAIHPSVVSSTGEDGNDERRLRTLNEMLQQP